QRAHEERHEDAAERRKPNRHQRIARKDIGEHRTRERLRPPDHQNGRDIEGEEDEGKCHIELGGDPQPAPNSSLRHGGSSYLLSLFYRSDAPAPLPNRLGSGLRYLSIGDQHMWLRRILITLLVLAAIGAPAYYWLIVDSSAPSSGSYTIDMVE